VSIDDETILAYLAEYRGFNLAHRAMVKAMAGVGTLPGITRADARLKTSLKRLRRAWGILSAKERIGLMPPPGAL
jgi:hypothetical protein